MKPASAVRERSRKNFGGLAGRGLRAVLGACILALASDTCATAGTAEEEAESASLPVAGQEVGATDPVGAADTNMFRDDELNLWGANRDGSSARFFPGAPTADDLMTWDFDFNAAPLDWRMPFGWYLRGDNAIGTDGKPDYALPLMAIAPGRVRDLLHDEVVMVNTDGVPGKVDVLVRSAVDGVWDWGSQLTTSEPQPDRIVGVDVAVGDLDRVVDDNGQFHDEIVVVWGPQGADCRARIDILDYTLAQIASETVGGCTGHVAVTIGDFNADRNLELAAVTDDQQYLRSKVCSLVLDSPDPPRHWHLDCLDEFAFPETFPALDIAAGKIFRSLGAEFLVIIVSPGAASSTNYFKVHVVGIDEEVDPPRLDLWQTFPSNADWLPGSYDIPGVHEVRVASGLFRYDLPNGYDFADRQLVTAALGGSPGSTTQTVNLWFWDMEFELHKPPGVFATAQTSISGRHTAKPSLTVGNFIGHGVAGDNSDPTMQAAVTFLNTTKDDVSDATAVTQESRMWKLVPPPSGSTNWGKLLTWSHSFHTNHGFNGYDPFMVTEDYDGDSWRLGIPFHIVINEDTSFNSLLEEPPKHVDYLPIDPDDLGKGFDVINISGYKKFKVQLKASEGMSVKTSKTDTTSWSIGAGIDVSYDYQVNREKLFALKQHRLDAHGELKVDGHYQQTVNDINSGYQQTTQTWTNSTDTDDQIDVSLQDRDVWRYPIIGFETGDASNPTGYYEIAIPGMAFSEQTGGMQKEWYTPLHVNNNVLSYPQNLRTDLPWVPADVGSFEKPKLDKDNLPIIGPDGKPVMEEVTDLMNDEIKYTWDGNEHTQDIQFNETAGLSHQKEIKGTLSEAVDLGIGLSNQMEVPGPGLLDTKKEFKGDFNFNNANSWGGEDVASTEFSDSTGITLSVPAISGFSHEGRSYSFTTAIYASTEGGRFKVAHTILDLITEPQDWWVKQYGRAPDPALNLPFRFLQHDADSQHSNLEWWTLRTADNDAFDVRHQMRGFFMRNNYLDDVSGTYELVSERDRIDGDTILLCARVYNFSLGVMTGNFDADFYYYAWNTRTGKEVDRETGEEAHKRVWIGKAAVGNLDKLSTAGAAMREVCVPWDTTGLSQVADPDIGYRFLVNLDESDEVKGEIHELNDAQGEEAPGGNNSGRWPWSGAIMVRSAPEEGSAARGPRLVNSVLEDTRRDANFRLSEAGIAIETAAGFVEGEPPVLRAGVPCRLRAHIVSEEPFFGNLWVAFFDGKPKEGGKLIALEHVGGLRQGDNYAWAHWTPEKSGDYELRAYAFHRVSAANREGGTTSRSMTVRSADEGGGGGGGGGGDGCSLAAGRGSALPAGGSLAVFGLLWLASRGMKRRRGRI